MSTADAAEQFARLREAFHRLLDLDLAARAATLAALAIEQPQLARQLDGLFDRLDEADLLAPAEPVPPERLGPFRVGRRIGRGGMGEVYLGERIDGGFSQQVALKLVRSAALLPDLARRFVRERQILARLQHPHIARLIDGGMAADGRPWLAMEYIDGERITSWCASHGLDIAARVRLLLPVVDAVQAAHRSLIVHRDIKPGNVLVDAAGRPQLLDFGIARLLDDEGVDGVATQVAMTPAYAAPEQRSGGEISTATDVFQLGALLRELIDGAGQAVPASLRRIVGRATAERPVERYASAAALGDDLADWLARRPLRSGIDGSPERLRLLLRQWRWPLLMALMVLLALGSGGLLAWREARIAQARAQEAQANLQALLGIIAAANPGRYAGREPPVGELLVQVAGHLQVESADDPHLLQQALGGIGHGLLNLGRAGDAEPVLLAAVAALARDPAADVAGEIGLLKLLVLALDDPSSLPVARRSAGRLHELAASHHATRGAALDALASSAAALARLGDIDAAQRLFVDVDALGVGEDTMSGAQAENYWRQRGLVALRSAQPAEARQAFLRSRQIQQRAPAGFGALRRAELLLFLAEAALAEEDSTAAAEALQQAAPTWQTEYPASHREQAYFATLMARLQLLRGQEAAALALARSAVRGMPASDDRAAAAQRVLAVALARSGRCDDAAALAARIPSARVDSPRLDAERRWLQHQRKLACDGAR